DYRQDLAKSHHDRGALLAETGRLDEAEQVYQESLGIQKKLATDFPEQANYGNDLAQTMVDLAELLRDRQEYRQARGILEAARPYHQAALDANPLNPIYRQFFQNNQIVLASVWAGLGDQASALQVADHLAARSWNPATDAYAAARALAQCCHAVEKKAQLQEAAKSYAERALAMLQQAVRNGYADALQMKKDGYLAPLRSRPEFQKLIAELTMKRGSK